MEMGKRISWERWKNTARRIVSSITLSVGPITFNPSVAQRTVAERAITYLESEGLLYTPFAWEMPDRCYADADKLREKLTEKMEELSHDTYVFRQLDEIRNACRIFRDKLRRIGIQKVSDHSNLRPDLKAKYLEALGGLRNTIGTQIMLLSVEYHIDVAEHLADQLPPPDSTENES